MKGDDKEYDFCHYDIKVDLNDEDTKKKIEEIKKKFKKPKILVKMTKNQNINVNFYGGVKGSTYPTLKIIYDNSQPILDKVYQIDVDKTFFIVAHPVINKA